MKCHSDSLKQCGFSERKILWQAINNARRNRNKFRESSGATIVTAGNAEHLAPIAQIDIAAEAVGAFSTVDG
jgi:hypothetical protein